MSHEVTIVTVPEMTYAVVHFHVRYEDVPRIGEHMGRAFGTVMAELSGTGTAPGGPAVAHYQPTADGFDVAAGFRVPPTFEAAPPLHRLDLGGVEAAHTTHLGSYEGLSAAYDDLQKQAEAMGRTLGTGGPMWEEYWSGPGTPEELTRTEVFWPVSAAEE